MKLLIKSLLFGLLVCCFSMPAWSEEIKKELSYKLELSGLEFVSLPDISGFILADSDSIGSVYFLQSDNPLIINNDAVTDIDIKLKDPIEVIKPDVISTNKKRVTVIKKSKYLPVCDIEGLASNGSNVLYILSSHKSKKYNSESIKRRYDREIIIKSKIHRHPDKDRIKIQEAEVYSSFLEDCTKELKEKLGLEVNNDSLSKNINLEGLAFDGKNLYIGVRAPLTKDNKAVVIKVNPDDLFGNTPKNFEFILVNLEGLGIRSLDYDNKTKELICIAGESLSENFKSGKKYVSKIFKFDLEGKNLKEDKTIALDGNNVPEGIKIVQLKDKNYMIVVSDKSHTIEVKQF